MSYTRYHSGGDDLAAGLTAWALFLAALLLAALAYYAFRAGWLVIHVFRRHPRRRALWSALGVCLSAWALVGLVAALMGATQAPAHEQAVAPLLVALVVVAGGATAALVITAKIIDLREDHLLQRELSKETLVEDVLQRPWWEAA
jgi:hypothetical protein